MTPPAPLIPFIVDKMPGFFRDPSQGKNNIYIYLLLKFYNCQSNYFVRANESCLLARLGHMDAGARDAADRRSTTMREERLDREEAAAFHQAYVRGRGGPRRGRLAE